MAEFVRRCQLCEIGVRHRVTFEPDKTGLLHLCNLIPRQVVWVGIRKIIDEKDRCLEPVLFQDGVGILVVVRITVVERDNDGLLRQWCPVFERIHHLVDRDCRIALG